MLPDVYHTSYCTYCMQLENTSVSFSLLFDSFVFSGSLQVVVSGTSDSIHKFFVNDSKAADYFLV